MDLHPEHLRLHVIRTMLRTLNAEQTLRKRLLRTKHTPDTWREQSRAAVTAWGITELLDYRAILLHRKRHSRAGDCRNYASVCRKVDAAVALLPPKPGRVPA